MPTLYLRPGFLSEQESKEVASRQLLSFLFIPPSKEEKKRVSCSAGTAPSKSLFSFKALPKNAFTKGSALFNWSSRNIYDVDGRLLFRDQTIRLGSGNELQVRTAGSDLLRTPVWSIRAGAASDIEALIAKALSVIRRRRNLEPLLVDNEATVRLVCYSYPKLGILCYSRTDPATRFVIDLWDLIIIPLDSSERHPPPESVITIWSPYDMVVPATLGQFRSQWNRRMALLPVLPKTVRDLPNAIMKARSSILEEHTTNPELIRIAQTNNVRCAAATAQMILQHHGITRRQHVIALAMNTNSSSGAEPLDQVKAIPGLTNNQLQATLDKETSFSEAKMEILQNRPFKTGGAGHARACGGFKLEEGDKNWLYIYDPWPSNTKEDNIYYEAWDVDYHANYMYVQPQLLT